MTEEQAIEARRLYSQGWKRLAIATQIGATEGAVNYATRADAYILNIPAVTRPQAEALAYLGWFTAKHGRAPSLSEMASHFDAQPGGIALMLHGLVRKRLINSNCQPTRPTA